MQRHSVDMVSLLFGAFFVAVAVVFMPPDLDTFRLDLRWMWPALLVVIGLAFLVPSRRRARAPQVDMPGPDVEAAKDELFPSPLD